MERITAAEKRPSLLIEHRHRYAMAAEVSRGAVLDASCGVGYGAPILMAQPAVSSYVGIDVSDSAIKDAQKEHAGPNIAFQVEDITNLPFEDESFDTVVSLETLEHLEKPQAAIKEIKRVLKKRKGIFIGSVPTDEYEAYCENVFGENEYHYSRFTYEALSNLLNDHFKAWKMYICALELGSLTRLRGQKKFPTTSSKERISMPNQGVAELGSFFFIATDNPRFALKKVPFLNFHGDFRYGVNFAPFAKAEILPLYDTIDDTEKLVADRSELLRRTEELVTLRDEELARQGSKINALEVALRSAEELIKERDRLIASQDEIVKDRESSIASYEESVREKLEYIKKLEELAEHRWQIIQKYESDPSFSKKVAN